jgi:hypothetical protein
MTVDGLSSFGKVPLVVMEPVPKIMSFHLQVGPMWRSKKPYKDKRICQSLLLVSWTTGGIRSTRKCPR